MIQQSHYWYICKGTEMSLSMRYLHMRYYNEINMGVHIYPTIRIATI
jgi:hypothetical protein